MMKKWNRLAALVLALVLALSAFTTALAYQDGVPAI